MKSLILWQLKPKKYIHLRHYTTYRPSLNSPITSNVPSREALMRTDPVGVTSHSHVEIKHQKLTLQVCDLTLELHMNAWRHITHKSTMSGTQNHIQCGNLNKTTLLRRMSRQKIIPQSTTCQSKINYELYWTKYFWWSPAGVAWPSLFLWSMG